jgi:hypothetical protein
MPPKAVKGLQSLHKKELCNLQPRPAALLYLTGCTGIGWLPGPGEKPGTFVHGDWRGGGGVHPTPIIPRTSTYYPVWFTAPSSVAVTRFDEPCSLQDTHIYRLSYGCLPRRAKIATTVSVPTEKECDARESSVKRVS